MESSTSLHDQHSHHKRPQQYYSAETGRFLTERNNLRQQPSVSGGATHKHAMYRTPSERSTRSLPHINFDSPFQSPLSIDPSRSRSRVSTNSRTPAHTTMPRASFDSPFQSPPSAISSRNRRRTPQPLVLDPSASNFSTLRSNYSSAHNSLIDERLHKRNHQNNDQPLAQKFLQVATGRIRDQMVTTSSHYNHGSSGHHTGLHSTPAICAHSGEIAADFARHAPKAGFLQKLGQNIPEFKRRFFVLQTETNLYYYLSPNDTEPRGKLSLEGTRIQEIEELADGRHRFAILQEDGRRIVLEARSAEMGKEWMKEMEERRASILQEKVDELNSQVQRQNYQLTELQQQVENFKLVEADRDGAIEDARQWKEQFERLDEAIRLLTKKMRQPPKVARMSRRQEHLDDGEEKKETDPPSQEGESLEVSTDGTPIKNNQSSAQIDGKLPSNLLDSAFHAVDDSEPCPVEDVQEIMAVPGTYFAGLADACQHQRDSLDLASEEAATAVEDVQEAQSEVEIMKKRMERAEKELTKMWEENCTIRKSLKQTKREKRVLVREYKVLQQTKEELEEKARSPAQSKSSQVFTERRSLPLSGKENEVTKKRDNFLASDEERLIDELDEHVASSIQLHKRLLRAQDYLDLESDDELNTSVDDSETMVEVDVSKQSIFRVEGAMTAPSSFTPASASSKMTSLMDDDDEDDTEDEGASEEHEVQEDDLSVNEYQSMMSPSIVSSVGAEFGSIAEISQHSASSVHLALSAQSSPERPNPVLNLDKPDEFDECERQDVVCSTPTTTASKDDNQSNIQATSRLACPLDEALQSTGYTVTTSAGETEVYHLTFYSKKIGIQFQKAPPAPMKPKGLLTAALTADLHEKADDSDKTAAELRSVAALSSMLNGSTTKRDETCPLTFPKDIVLVCGFQGFDESSNNKPKLGARLVAFDGLSVEIGPWTFDAIRKAIQSRKRPLTLSFRNDYLTSEQKAVLTKAVMEVDAKRPPAHPVTQIGPRPPSTTPSLASTITHDTDLFAKDDGSIKNQHLQDLSSWAQDKDCCHSVSTHYGRIRRLSSGSHSTHQGGLKSFSDAGGSSISSSFAPLVAKLVKQANSKQGDDPKLFRSHHDPQRNQAFANTPQHRQFQSSLL